MARLTGAEILVETLKAHGVQTIFGYPGGSVLPIYDALYKQQRSIRHVLTSHEQNAAHAADGYARASGRTGVCLATSGPGATNLVTGIATAFMDSTPMVCLTGNVPSHQIGTDSFQEVDIVGITMPVTKYNYFVRKVEDLRPTLEKAFALAGQGRPGPVLVDIPKDVQIACCDVAPFPPVRLMAEPIPLAQRAAAFAQRNASALETALDMMKESRRPFLLLGGGAVRAGASEEVLALAEALRCPVSATLMALGVFPTDHPQYAGNFGMHGMERANLAFSECDLLIAVGTRFNDRISSDARRFLGETKLLQIDIDPSEVGKIIPAHHALVADAAVALRALNQRLTDGPRDETWLRAALQPSPPQMAAAPDAPLSPRPMLGILREVLGEEALVATDVGQHQMWTAQYLPLNQPGMLITSGGLGTMGFGLGAAIGAAIARPETAHALVTGDGSFRMNLTELSTLAAENLPVAIVLMNNGVLGMVRQWQTLFYEKRYSATTLDRGPDFMKLADAYGIEGFQPHNLAEYRAALTWVREQRRPALLDCRLDSDAMVRPMVAPGMPLSEFILHDEERGALPHTPPGA